MLKPTDIEEKILEMSGFGSITAQKGSRKIEKWPKMSKIGLKLAKHAKRGSKKGQNDKPKPRKMIKNYPNGQKWSYKLKLVYKHA